MKIIIEGDAKEIAALVVAVQERRYESATEIKLDGRKVGRAVAETTNQAMRENKKTMLIT